MQQDVKLKHNYSCPKCDSFLRIWNNIIFTISTKDGKKRGILLLNPKLGDYTMTSHPSLRLEEGEIVDFFCPVCHENLAATEINSNLVRIVMTDDTGHYDVYFSRITGEHSTFKIHDKNIIAKYGKDDSHYVNYFISKFREQNA